MSNSVSSNPESIGLGYRRYRDSVSKKLSRLPGTPDPMLHFRLDSGLDIACDCWGPASGLPALLLHGGGQTRHAWRSTGMRLGEAGYRAMAVDLRGHGDSSWDDQGNYGHDSFLEDLLSVVAHCGLEKPVLIGASLGGAVCLLAVGEGLVEASALALVDTAPNIEPAGVKNLRSFMTARPEGFERLEEVAESVAAYKGSGRRPKSLEGLAKNVRIDEEGRYHWHWDPRFMHRPSSSENWEERRSRLEACARRLALPTLLVRGGLSDMLSEKGARSFLELCPRSEYVSIDDARHMVAGDHNDRFTVALLEFLNRSVSLGS